MKERLLGWMRGGEGCFEEMALEVFAWQFQNNQPYRRYCESLGRVPGMVPSWSEIPAVPTDVFKLQNMVLRCFSTKEVVGFFLTSGTTREVKGRHEFASLELYEAAVLGCWREANLPEISSPWFFSQRVESAPHSSLVRMFEILGRGKKASWLIDAEGRLDLKAFAQCGKEPVQLLGTSIALLRACDEMPTVELPEGSWIFETGGSKGLTKSFSPEEVREKLSAHFGIPKKSILNEYGMTELFSQFYKWGEEEVHKGPPWVGTRVVDLETGTLARPGSIGYLEVVDLANVDSVMAVRTQDLAIAVGEREFRLIGRDPQAVARGCSRGVDDVLSSR